MKCLKAHGNFKACKARVEEVKTKKWSMNFSCRCFMVSLKLKENHKLHNLVKTLLLIHSTLPALPVKYHGDQNSGSLEHCFLMLICTSRILFIIIKSIL